MPAMKTLAEHREYLHEIVRLKLFFLHRVLTAHPEWTFRDALRNRVDIYRKTDFNRGLLNPAEEEIDFAAPGWQEVETELERLFQCSGADAAGFERDGFEVLRAAVDRRVRRDYIDVSRINGYQCGSLRYNRHESGARQEVIGFHIGNAIQPESMFADPLYLCYCFAELMRQTELKHGSTRLHTCTWLNSLPKWLEYFPGEYVSNREPELEEVQWHYGFWGQFITARGTFNYKYGEILRSTGRFPYLPRASQCSFDSMRRHLREKFSFDC